MVKEEGKSLTHISNGRKRKWTKKKLKENQARVILWVSRIKTEKEGKQNLISSEEEKRLKEKKNDETVRTMT